MELNVESLRAECEKTVSTRRWAGGRDERGLFLHAWGNPWRDFHITPEVTGDWVRPTRSPAGKVYVEDYLDYAASLFQDFTARREDAWQPVSADLSLIHI